MPMEIVLDMVRLALFDVILYCDDSGSMCQSIASRERGGC
jgi:hypothetical protein